MTTREQRARMELDSYRRHRESAMEDMATLQRLYHDKNAGPLGKAWELIGWQTLAAINVDSGRLLRAVTAVLDMADGDTPLSRNAIYNAVMTALNFPEGS